MLEKQLKKKKYVTLYGKQYEVEIYMDCVVIRQ